MKTKILGCIVGLGAVTCSLISCTEPQPACLVEDDSGGDYIMTYIVQGTAPACAASILIPGEPVGMSFYHPEVTNSDGSTTFDASIGHVAIQALTIGNADENVYGAIGIADTTPGHEPFAYGRFKVPAPDTNNLCYVVTDQGISCTAASQKCSVDEDCCNGQCNIAANFTCTGDSDCPTGTTCGCKKSASDPTTCNDVQEGGTCTGPSLCAALEDNLTAVQDFPSAMDTGQFLSPPVGTPCMADADCGFCADTGATCATGADCCSGVCTGTTCGMPPMGMTSATPTGLSCNTAMGACALAACDPTNAAGQDADCGGATSGLVCNATTTTCQLGCRGAMGNGCDATFACSSTDTTIGSCGLPQQAMSYAWSNVMLYTTAAVQGTQISADVAVTQTVNGAACTINYKAIGMWPAVACGGSDDMGNPTGMPDDDLCNPCAEPSIGRSIGSGINFAFPVHCDPNLLTCVLVDEASYSPVASDLAKGILSSGTTKPATSIPQLMPAGDARQPVCQGD